MAVEAAVFASPGALPKDAVEVGCVIGAWGIRGGIKVKPFASNPQALFSSKRWFLQPSELPRPPGAKPAQPLPALLRVASAREHGDGVVATVQDLVDRGAAEALKGARIFISRASFPTPDADEFYWVDLIGLTVRDRQGSTLGAVAGLIETGPHSVLRVQPADTSVAEVLIPFVAAYVDGVDLAARCVTVDWQADWNSNV